MILSIPKPCNCPVCDSAPYVEQCEPWPRGHGPAPWSVGCYRMTPIEHFVGVNGDNQLDAIRAWNAECDFIRNGDFET